MKDLQVRNPMKFTACNKHLKKCVSVSEENRYFERGTVSSVKSCLKSSVESNFSFVLGFASPRSVIG